MTGEAAAGEGRSLTLIHENLAVLCSKQTFVVVVLILFFCFWRVGGKGEQCSKLLSNRLARDSVYLCV